MSLEGGLDQWFIETLLDLQASGWRCVPIFEGGGTLPYGDGQTYYCPTEYLGKAVAIGVVLDSAVLLDWDGNKPEAVGKIISLEALGYELGADLAAPAQSNKAGNSLHYLWRWREGFEPQRASCDGWKPFVDLKTGNQLMHLKPGKILTDGELPPVGELDVAAEALEAAFNGGYRRDKSAAGDVATIGRNSTLTSYVGSLIHQGTPVNQISARAMAKNATFHEPLDEAEVLKVVKSVVATDVSRPENVASYGAELARQEEERAKVPALPSDLLQAVEWVVDGFISSGCMVVAGARGAGKTTALVPLCVAVCGSIDISGLDIRVKRHIVYFAEDIGQVYRSLHGMVYSGANRSVLDDRFHVIQAERVEIHRYERLVASLREQYSYEVDGVMVEPLFVMDTARACFSVESENDNTAVSDLIMNWRRYCGDAPSLIVTHVTKLAKDADVAQLSSAGADAWESNTQGQIGLGMMDRNGSAERVLWAGAGMKRRDQGPVEGIVIRGEKASEPRDAGIWGEQEVGFMTVQMEVLGFGERIERIEEGRAERERMEAFAESVQLQARIKEVVAEHMHRQQCDPMAADSYAHKTAIARALGCEKGNANNRFSEVLQLMVDAGDLVFVGREVMGSNEAKLHGSIKGYYVNAGSIGRA